MSMHFLSYLAARKKMDRLADMKALALPLVALGCLCLFVAGCNSGGKKGTGMF